MNPDLPPMKREDLEAKVTALLLGELPAEEAALLRELIARDTGLARWRDRLKLTLELLRETTAADNAAPAPAAPLKLSEARREKLLAHFKTVAPKEFAPRPRRLITLPVAVAAVAAVMILASMVLPSLSRAKQKSQQNAIINNLRLLDSSKHQWALEQRKSDTDVPTLEDLKHYFGRGAVDELPRVAGETYYLGAVGQPPVAQLDKGRDKKAVITLPGEEGNLASVNQPAPAPGAPPPPQAAPSQSQIVLPSSPPSTDGEVALALTPSPRSSFANNMGTAAPSRQREQLNKVEPTNASPAQEPDQSVYTINAVGYINVNTQQGFSIISCPLITNVDSVATLGGTNLVLPVLGSAPLLGTLFAGKESKNATDLSFDVRSPKSADVGGVGGGAYIGALSNPIVQSRTNPFVGRYEYKIPAGRFPGSATDRPGNGQVAKSPEPELLKPEVINMKYAQAGDIASALSALGASGGASVGRSTSRAAAVGGHSTFQENLNRVVQDAASSGQFQLLGQTKIIADERSNSLLVFANDDDKKKIDDIIKKLDVAANQPALPPPVPQPEVLASTNIFSTFSLNVSDASFKLAAASLQNGVMPEAAGIRSEEFINAFDYRDPEAAPGAPIGFAWERAGYPFAHNRDLLRFSVKTAAQGRQTGRPLNLVLLLDKSGSMERADRVEIIRQALRVLAAQLQAPDTLSVVVFARTARLWVDGVPGSQAGDVANGLNSLAPEGGTNLEEAMRLAYATALRHYKENGENRVVLLTDGAANLGDVEPESLKQKVEANRRQGIALDCFGVGWDGYNDPLMETLSRTGNGRYGFINTPEEAAREFAGKLAGALRVAAVDVKVQVEFNPNRVTAWRQLGYAKHQLTKEQFRDNTVAAAQIGAAESGNALYTVEIAPAGDGPLCTVRVRFRLPGTTDYQEHAWEVPYTGTAVTLDKASPAMRLAATASAFSEWLASSPFAGEVTPDQLLAYLRGVPELYGADVRPKTLEWMIRQAKSIAGK